MSLGFRIFFLNENDVLIRIPVMRFEAFYLRGDRKARFREYAGQRIRYALVILEVKSRKPVAIQRIDCSIMQLNDNGELDRNEWLRRAALGMSMVDARRLNTT